MIKNLLPLIPLLLLVNCSSDDNTVTPETPSKQGCTVPLSDNYDPTAVVDDGSCLPFSCAKCTYTIPTAQNLIDGAALGIKPGDVICLDAAIQYANLHFTNLVGTADKPIVIVNCGGVVTIDATGKAYGIKTDASKYFKITGLGSSGSPYGIKLFGANQGMQLQGLSTNFEVSHMEIYDAGFAGIMAKTDPTCDPATNRGGFVMNDIAIHHNYVHDTGGEGMYIGHSFYKDGITVSGCGIQFPHDIHGAKIYQNIVEKTGWDGIQVGSATQGAEIYNNTVEDFGTKNVSAQWSGIQLGEGTGGKCYNNLIQNGTGQGLNVLGYGDNVIYNNVVVNPAQNGAFCDERFTPGDGFKFINNTFVSPGQDGIKTDADLPMNAVINNIIVNPGTINSYGTNTDKAFVHINGSVNDLYFSNNYFAKTIAEVKFKDPGNGNYQLTAESPAVDAGRDVSTFGVTIDFLGVARPKGTAFDIGAYEF